MVLAGGGGVYLTIGAYDGLGCCYTAGGAGLVSNVVSVYSDSFTGVCTGVGLTGMTGFSAGCFWAVVVVVVDTGLTGVVVVAGF